VLERRYWSGALGADELALAYGGIDCAEKKLLRPWLTTCRFESGVQL